MRTVFTLEEAKRVVEGLYNGNLAEYKAKKGAVEYINENSEKILLKDEYGQNLGEKDLAQYLNLHFYTWRNRVVESERGEHITINGQESIEAWVKSLNGSMNDAYALVEATNENSVPSQDIDSSEFTGRVTVIIQADKVANLDYYARKIRNKFLGTPQLIQNANGDMLVAKLNMGVILYDSEPTETQLGETVIVSFNFTIKYISNATCYEDYEFEFALYEDPDEAVNPDLPWSKLPLTEAKLTSIFTFSSVPYARRADNTGGINTAISNNWTLAFFDYKSPFVDTLNRYFYSLGASKYKIEEEGETWENVQIAQLNVPVFVKLKVPYSYSYDGTPEESKEIYKYEYIISEMRKQITNGDFTVTVLTLRGRSKSLIPAGEEVVE